MTAGETVFKIGKMADPGDVSCGRAGHSFGRDARFLVKKL